MAQMTLREWMGQEIPAIEQALADALSAMPEPARPVAAHVLKAGGKRVRPMLVILFAGMFGMRGDAIYSLASCMELLHAATLLHDDILDNAASRRGQPAAHTIFGIAPTILAGDAMLAQGNLLVAEWRKPDLVECYSRATIQTAAGEIYEMNFLGQPDLAHERYLEIARGKTACLIAQSCRLGALAGGADAVGANAACVFGENLGLAFQLVDDALDFASEKDTGKPAGGDLREGKMTPPIRLYRARLDDNRRQKFDEAFRQRSFSETQIEELSLGIRQFIPDTLELANASLETAREALKDLPSVSEKFLLEQMLDYVRDRRK